MNRAKELKLPDEIPDLNFSKVIFFLIRVLSTILMNAYKTTDEWAFILLSVYNSDSKGTSGVWNRWKIDPDVSKRIFQKNFSTKGSRSRGLGAYSIYLPGERVLDGTAAFISSVQMEYGSDFHYQLHKFSVAFKHCFFSMDIQVLPDIKKNCFLHEYFIIISNVLNGCKIADITTC